MPIISVDKADVKKELDSLKGDVAKLSTKYFDEMKKIQDNFGGSRGDIPMDSNFWTLQAKLRILNTLDK